MIKKADGLGHDAAREDHGESALRKYQNAHPPVFSPERQNQKSQDQQVWEILREENSDIVKPNAAICELMDEVEERLVEIHFMDPRRSLSSTAIEGGDDVSARG